MNLFPGFSSVKDMSSKMEPKRRYTSLGYYYVVYYSVRIRKSFSWLSKAESDISSGFSCGPFIPDNQVPIVRWFSRAIRIDWIRSIHQLKMSNPEVNQIIPFHSDPTERSMLTRMHSPFVPSTHDTAQYRSDERPKSVPNLTFFFSLFIRLYKKIKN